MSYPILGISGAAGSGKDTVGAIAAKQLNGTCIALADSMKRLADLLFEFTPEQLWGPSACRNAKDPKWTSSRILGALQAEHIPNAGLADDWMVRTWLDDVVPGLKGDSMEQLGAWYISTLKECLKRGELTPRYVLQTLGTQWGRQQDKNIWVNYAMRMAEGVLNGRGYDNRVGLNTKSRTGGPDHVIITDVRFRNEVLAIKAKGGQVWQVFDPNAAKDVEVTGGIKGHASEAEMKGIPRRYFDAIISNDKEAGISALTSTLLDPDGPLAKLRAGPRVTRVYDFCEGE